MDETAALRQLVSTLEAQVSNQCATILRLRRDLKQLQARGAAGPASVEGRVEWLGTIFAPARRQN